MDSKYHNGLGIKLDIEIKREKLEEANRLTQRRVPTVVLSQLKGVPVDQKVVRDLAKKYGAKVQKALAEIMSLPVVKKV